MEFESKIVTFYLPQYHPIKENNNWWGPGFTEWTNVSKARPNFTEHYQPRIPRDLGFYDLRRTETFREQAALAKEYGIYGFCFYWYWFDGQQLLETPLYNLLNEPSIELPFCFCWANENWTRTWDGQDKQVLMKQDYNGPKLTESFIETMLPFFKDRRYIKIDGKPVLLVYRCDIIPQITSITSKWRETARAHGFPDIYLVAVHSFSISDHEKYGFDAGVEFPPHQVFGDFDFINRKVQGLNPEFKGGIIDYRTAIIKSKKRNQLRPKNSTIFRGAMPSWDNTARRQLTGHIFKNSTPALFQYWLSDLIADARKKKHPYVFINAWNEWAEGCHLEPDQKYKHEYLQAVKNALNDVPVSESTILDMQAYEEKLSRISLLERVRNYIKTNPALYRLARPVYQLYRGMKLR